MKIKHKTRFEIEHLFVVVFVVSLPPALIATILLRLLRHGQSLLNILHSLFFFILPQFCHVLVVIRLLALLPLVIF